MKRSNYECKNPRSGYTISTDSMFEADFWAMCGYIIFDACFWVVKIDKWTDTGEYWD